MYESNRSLESTPDIVPEDKVVKGYSFLGIGLTMLLVTAAFFSGIQLGSSPTSEASSQRANIFSIFNRQDLTAPPDQINLDSFWRVWNLMDEKYVLDDDTEEISREERLEGAIDGLVASYGDPYSVFLPPKKSQEFAETISGNFSGVGMEVGMRNGVITVISPLPETPAEKAGILSGDIIVRIDERSTERMSIDEAVGIIRGEKGSTVTLTIVREGENELIEISVVRDVISIPTIKTEQDGDVFIISLYSFNAVAEALMQDALREYVRSGAKKMILDLRGNPGGFLQSANAISSFFLPTGKVIVRENFGKGRDEVLYRSQGRVLHQFAPEEMIILIDQGSASASEIVAGALREHGIATLFGETTFGKGSVQELVSLPGGASLKVTIARWLTPNGVSISEGGLAPDITVARTPEDRVNEVDPQKEAALKWLRGDRAFVEDLVSEEGVAEELETE